eukprot:COSAG01_NODE_41390_length_452_cov_0.719547_2_plen_26_part_01
MFVKDALAKRATPSRIHFCGVLNASP